MGVKALYYVLRYLIMSSTGDFVWESIPDTKI